MPNTTPVCTRASHKPTWFLGRGFLILLAGAVTAAGGRLPLGLGAVRDPLSLLGRGRPAGRGAERGRAGGTRAGALTHRRGGGILRALTAASR